MMHKRAIAITSASAVAAAVVLMSSVDWFAASTGRQGTETGARLAPKPVRVLIKPTVGQSRTGGAHDLMEGRALARELRKAGLETVATAADSAGEHADSVLADAALVHADAAIREEAIHALGERSGNLAVQTLEQTIHDPHPRIRYATVRALKDVGTEEAARILGGALSAQDASLRLDAVEALGDIGSPAAVLYIRQVLGDESLPVREAAAQWLAELSGERR